MLSKLDHLAARDSMDDSSSVDPVTLDDSTSTGNDTLGGGSGDDHIKGGNGNDAVAGGAGNDNEDGGNGDDSLSGGDGNDTVAGGAGNDSLDGGNGDDSLSGGIGKDSLAGGAGNDKEDGGAGADSLDGGAGKDTLAGGAGNDTLTGGTGHDVFVMGLHGGKDVITDFTVKGANGDKIDLHLGGTTLHNLHDILAHTTEVGGNAVIALSHGSSLTLDGVDMHSLTLHDFVM